MTKLIVVLVGLAITATMSALVRRRVHLAETRGGCVACGSLDLERSPTELRCRGCGYVGAYDRGGALSEDEIRSLYADDRDKRR